jgi:hypothetical protein
VVQSTFGLKSAAENELSSKWHFNRFFVKNETDEVSWSNPTVETNLIVTYLNNSLHTTWHFHPLFIPSCWQVFCSVIKVSIKSSDAFLPYCLIRQIWKHFHRSQGDQIGRIFGHWVAVYYGQFF